ncbi:TnsA endonuclease N-terminal domain-containing protein [Sphaerotilus sp.]|uniref:TnsA endonuclease N-terminal domain-containing protein n=1 Tax=Sphaerotilus sp. TaxID=2093942 RepID=UPI002ACE9DE1|nr:TnsA endonuclease N-terminal domain-containing protein [Sphaerotilus sp.]MDZ7854818.1 TnsA endonuclease N-terminal domain-containing protein [Sphaerotilus sp.]
MPSRKIPKNHLFVTGAYASSKSDVMIGFESLLEKEYMLLLDFDPTVEKYVEQPVTLPVPGKSRRYTPDLLVTFRKDSTGHRPPAQLIEVKTTAELTRKAEDLEPKFAVAEKYATDRGWIFLKKTELDIRTQRLANLKFLRRYRNLSPAPEEEAGVLARLQVLGGTAELQSLLDMLGATPEEQAQWTPILWNLVVRNRIMFNIDREPLSSNVEVWLPGN